MWSMVDIYNVMEYLNWSKLDREYPINMTNELTINSDDYVVTTIWEDFDNITVAEIYYKNNLPENPQITFSTFENGDGEIVTINDCKIKKDSVLFFVSDDSRAMQQNRLLTGIKSLRLKNMENTTITNIVFKTKDYNFTLRNIETQLTNAENYITEAINICPHKTIPDSLKSNIYKLAAAYCWQMNWENEGQGMEVDKNYASRLIEQVNYALNNYVETNCNDDDYNELQGSGFTKVRWGLH